MGKKLQKVSVFWFRRDLRLTDNTGLHFALKENPNVLPIFIFDTDILNKLDDKQDARVTFIYNGLSALRDELKESGSSLLVRYGNPLDVFRDLLHSYTIIAVYCNHDYEPYAISRDNEIANYLKQRQISFKSFKDQVVFEKDEVVKEDKTPYTVFTPYMRKWKALCKPEHLKALDTRPFLKHFLKTKQFTFPELKELGFKKSTVHFPAATINIKTIQRYDVTRDIPSITGTSRLSVHLRFGTVSIRQLASKAMQYNEKWLNELIWREFFMMILWHFPQVVKKSFKPRYDNIEWRNDEKDFNAWCEGKTGYPFVDAGMRELNATGYMHNRLRMVTAGFLTKHLLIDWRWGEAYFAKKLLDYELASNNGNWQWAAGCGCDAAPYFRVFNPGIQQKKFDPDYKYVRKWIPGFKENNYLPPLVEHPKARTRAIATYKKALKS